ncbi:hypothetical protein ISN44_As09g003610 [Arabidopsis suecica]|uniref:KIB1-4 beta-propeller domain-containing protein n=1 Tax=Arabidopsis suecica TaxID=45249 RepID=A0A8T2AG07_ARASU|nr:hypothetical protein ISN44_As09g003610 [Arabidopsis suecica]
MEELDRPAAVAVKQSGIPKYNECAKAPRVDPKSGSPMLLLSREERGIRLCKPDEDMFYEMTTDFSGYRFLASSGKWFLVVDSRSDLYIIDVFSDERIRLPPLESIKGGLYMVERVGSNEFKVTLIRGIFNGSCSVQTTKYLRGLLWVDDKNGDFVVVWQFEEGQFLGFCKKGDLHYRDIPIRVDVRREFRGLKDVVLKGYNLYSLVTRSFIRHLDLSGQDGFKDVSVIPRFPMWKPYTPRVDFGVTEIKKVISFSDSIAVTTSGEVLLVFTKAYEPFCERSRIFRVYKRDPKELDPNTYDTRLVEMESIGDEALFFDLGITVPADHTLGIEPNSIYFTRNDRFGHKNISIPCLIDICVYNIATRTIKRFPSLSNLKLKDAQWFLPS